ncbi:hypothetical protein BDF20DRAFT_843019 [Mycotypha africana]|uniref:uncharacterized protein n=1 Tax=Mycotypha africana TaxID=64632 RepID=UPI0023015E9A|nr:uncharacterized protein BDF20DRAFT_843019 [Mycotypha africana]KAI8991150.1 hypothetical protein BDF20DRAFT_843019 [Mycotypha africana]
MWRRGPQGAGTLCNACGVKWKHGKILCDTADYRTGTMHPHPAKKKKRNNTASATATTPNNANKRRKSATAVTTTGTTISHKKKLNDDSSSLPSISSPPQFLPSSPFSNFHQRRHTTDMSSLLHNSDNGPSMIDITDFPALNAVEEAAAVLTLLKRS